MHSSFSLVALLLGSASASAIPTSSSRRDTTGTIVERAVFNVDAPAPTPLHIRPPSPIILSHLQVRQLFYDQDSAVNSMEPEDFLATNSTMLGDAARVAMNMMNGLKMEMVGILQDSNQLTKRARVRQPTTNTTVNATATASVSAAAGSPTLASPVVVPVVAKCVGSGSNDSEISSLFFYGGKDYTVNLCPSAKISITGPVFFYAAGQTLQTQGLPTGAARATLIVKGKDQACAVYGAIEGGNSIALRNIQVDGSRASMGIIYGGLANIEMGGNTFGQIIDRVRSIEPRGWSAMHMSEGYANSCRAMQVTNNDIASCGHAPSGPQQFRKRDMTGTYTPGQWADGISMACTGSIVKNNMIVDATDGAIVIFGAPGTVVSGNTIQANTRQLLGVINMVDWSPFAGSFEGTVVKGNTIQANGAFIKRGIAIGGMCWGVDNRTAARTYGGSVESNTFSSGRSGYFQFAIAAVGHTKVSISGNTAKEANFGGIPSSSCFPQFPAPAPQAFVADLVTVPLSTMNAGTTWGPSIVIPICAGPGPILKRGNAI